MTDHAFLQNGIDNASQTQQPWEIPQGSYDIDEPLILRTNAQISGMGPTFGGVRIRPRNCPTFILNGDDGAGTNYAFFNSVRNLMVWERDSDVPAEHAVKFGKCYSNVFENVRFHEMKATKIIDHQAGNNNRLTNIVAYGVGGETPCTGLDISGGSLLVDQIDLEVCWNNGVWFKGGRLDLRSPYIERCGVAAIRFENGQDNGHCTVTGGYIGPTNTNHGLQFRDCSQIRLFGTKVRDDQWGTGGWVYGTTAEAKLYGCDMNFKNSPIPLGLEIL